LVTADPESVVLWCRKWYADDYVALDQNVRAQRAKLPSSKTPPPPQWANFVASGIRSKAAGDRNVGPIPPIMMIRRLPNMSTDRA
jgi:hypothetical protein